ncbi:hypothetical protein [Sagittula sp. S175]|uniref:hypothetical protein n=1 Tax=Sagittula sp. S175 TaxID=3415129 RepID=UPI003C7AB0B2
MHGSRIQALTRQHKNFEIPQPGAARRMARRASLTGPVHRMSSAWQDCRLMDCDDPAAALLAPATQFYCRIRRTVRAGVFLAGSISMTPVLPMLFGLA